MNAPPRIEANELQKMATKYANQVIAELGELNRKYPRAEMDPEEEKAFLSKYGEKFSVDLERMRYGLESTFCQYMASRFIILPKE
jgi:hypothetical protein